jgi:hypothetical protein
MHTRTVVLIATFAATMSSAMVASAQAVASVPPPDGWKACPRCQNETDRKKANADYKVEGHRFNPRDLSGVWGNSGVQAFRSTPPPFTALGKQRFDETIGAKNAAGEVLHSKDTSGEGTASPINCDPKGWPRLHTYNYGFELVMLPDRVLQFFELTHTWRTIWTDGRKLPAHPPEPRWLGWSVGRWEGDTFIVESTGFDDRSWLEDVRPDGGWPHSEEMRVVERWRRVNYGTLEVQITVIDPQTYTEPWVTPKATIPLMPGAELWEDYCVPSDYNAFNRDVFLPVATGQK